MAERLEVYWLVGQRIGKEEQQRRYKARCGKRLIEDLSKALTAEFDKGFSCANLLFS